MNGRPLPRPPQRTTTPQHHNTTPHHTTTPHHNTTQHNNTTPHHNTTPQHKTAKGRNPEKGFRPTRQVVYGKRETVHGHRAIITGRVLGNGTVARWGWNPVHKAIAPGSVIDISASMHHLQPRRRHQQRPEHPRRRHWRTAHPCPRSSPVRRRSARASLQSASHG